MRRYKDLAVKYPRIGAFNLNGLRADCKMNCLALGRFQFARSDRSSRSPPHRLASMRLAQMKASTVGRLLELEAEERDACKFWSADAH